jgi:hypothetical protein
MPIPRSPRIPVRLLSLCALIAAGALPGCSRDTAPAPGVLAGASASCLPGERGFLRASLRGAIDSDLDWRGAALDCDGGARPNAKGVRVSFLGPPDARGRRLRLVFGIAARPGAGKNRNAATNITLIVEGQRRLYTTQGDDKCTVEALVQEALPAAAALPAGAPRPYRIAARGYCIDPATALDGTERLYVNRFDFAALARFDDNELHGITRD